ncbi:hypothetical protein G6F61_015021 [Rhizopus arrhizus]|nr:hypothetical protein G6F61_015021 [Rhizopus arrhizus]
MRAWPGCAECRRWASSAACSGGRSERATTFSMRASSTSSGVHAPSSAMRDSTLSRAFCAASGWRSGRSRLGACGSTASHAASACDNCAAGLPR